MPDNILTIFGQIDQASVAQMRKTIENGLKDINLSISSASLSGMSKLITEKVRPKIQLDLNENTLKGLNSRISEIIGKVKIKVDLEDKVTGKLEKLKTEGITIDLKINENQLKGFNKLTDQMESAFNKVSAAKDRFAANVDEKFPKIIARIAGVNAELLKTKELLDSSNPIGVRGREINPNTKNTQQTREIGQLNRQVGELTENLDKANNKLDKHRENVKAAAEAQSNFAARLGGSTVRLAAYLVPAQIISQLNRLLGFTASSVTELNRDFIKLQQTLGGSEERATRLSKAVLQSAADYGQAGEDVLAVTRLLAQSTNKFGSDKAIKSGADAILKTSLLATFGDIRETTEGTTAALTQFNKTGSATSHIIDVTNELAKSASVSASDFFEAIKSGGSAFTFTGGKIEEFAATVATLRQITGLSAGQIGAGINTITERAARPETVQFEERLTGGKIRNADGSLKGITQRWTEIAKATKSYTDEELARVIGQLADIRDGRYLIPLLRDIQKGADGGSIFIKNLQNIGKAPGSASRDAALGLNRIDIQISSIGAKFKEVLLQFAQDKGIQRLVTQFTDLAKGFASSLSIAEKLLPTLIKFSALRLTFLAAQNIPKFLSGARRTNASAELFGEGDPLSPSSITRSQKSASILAASTAAFQNKTPVVIAEEQNTQAVRALTTVIEQTKVAAATSNITSGSFSNRSVAQAVNQGIFSYARSTQAKARTIPLNVLGGIGSEVFGPPVPLRNTLGGFSRANQIVPKGTIINPFVPVSPIPFGLSDESRSSTFGSSAILSEGVQKLGLMSGVGRSINNKQARLAREAAQKLQEFNRSVLPASLTPDASEVPLAGRRISLPIIPQKPLDFFQLKGTAQGTLNAAGIVPPGNIISNGGQQSRNGSLEEDLRIGAAIAGSGNRPISRGSQSFRNLVNSRAALNNPSDSLGTARNYDLLRNGISENRDEQGILRDTVKNNYAKLATLSKQESLETEEVILAKKALALAIKEDTLAIKKLKTEEVELANAIAKETIILQRGVGGPVPGATGSVIGGLRSRAGSLGRTAASGLFESLGTVVPLIGGTILDNVATSSSSSIKPLVDQNGNLLQNALSINRNNTRQRLNTSTLSNASTGGLAGSIIGAGVGAKIGAGVGTVFGLPGTAAGGVIGSVAGFVAAGGITALISRISGKADADKQGREEILGAASSLPPTFDKKGNLISNFGNNSKLINAFLTQTANQTGTTFGVSNASSSFFALSNIGKATSQTYGFGNTKVGDLFQNEVAKNLKSEHGQAFVQSIQQRSIDLAQDLTNKGVKGQDLAGTIRETLKKDLINQIVSDGNRNGKPVNVKEITGRVSDLINESLRSIPEFGKELVGIADRTEEAKNKVNEFAKSVQTAGSSLDLFLGKLTDSIRDLNAGTSTNRVSSSLQSQFLSNISGKGTGAFQLPEELADSISLGLQKQFSKTGLSNTSDVFDARKLIQSSTDGLLSDHEQDVLSDTAILQQFARKAADEVASRFAGKAFQPGDINNAAPELGKIIQEFADKNKLFLGSNLKSEEGKNQLEQLSIDIVNRVKQNPQDFLRNPGNVGSEFLKEFSNGNPFREKLVASISNLNSSFDLLEKGVDKYRVVQEANSQLQAQFTSSRISQIRGSSVLGANPLEIINQLNNLPIQDSNLDAATNQLNSARQKAFDTGGLDASGNINQNLVSNSRQAAEAVKSLHSAQVYYNSELSKSNDTLAATRAKFEELNKVVGDLINTNKGIGSTSFRGQNTGRIDLQQFKGQFGGVLGQLGGLGVSNENDLQKLTPEQLKGVLDQLGPLNETQIGGLNNAESLFGGLQSQGSKAGTTNKDQIDLIKFLTGLASTGDLQNPQDALKLLQQRAGAAQGANSIESQQLQALQSIDANIARFLGQPVAGVTPTGGSQANTFLTQTPYVAGNYIPEPTKTPPNSNTAQREGDLVFPGDDLDSFLDAIKNNGSKDLKDSIVQFGKILDDFTTSIRNNEYGPTTNVQKNNGSGTQISDARAFNESKVNFNADINITGFSEIGKDKATAAIVTSLMQKFADQLDNSNASEAQLRSKLAAAIKQIHGSE